MEKKFLILDKECINKNAFHRYKKPITTNKVEIKKLVLSKKYSYDNKGTFKYFIGYMSNAGITPLCIILPQMNGYVKHFKNTKYMNLLVHDQELLKEYNETWDKIKSLFKKNLIVNQCTMINTLKLK